MAWLSEDRRSQRVVEGQPLLTDAMKKHLEDKYFPRYPSKRAVLLPALHMVQHEYNWIPPQAIEEIANFLEIAPAEALDTASFYEEYWLKPKGKYLLQVCRSLTCEICGGEKLRDKLTEKLKIDVGETTPDKRYTLVELECLGACGSAPVMLVNERLYENLSTDQLEKILAELPEDPHDFRDPDVTWEDSRAGH